MTYWLGGALGCAAPHQQVQEKQQTTADLLLRRLQVVRGDRVAGIIDHKDGPSLIGVDRSHWPKMTVVTVDGSSPHGILLFSDLSIDMEHVDPVDREHSAIDLDLSEMKIPASNFSRVFENAAIVEVQILRAMRGPNSQKWSRSNSVHAMVQPVKAALDLVTVPYRYFREMEKKSRGGSGSGASDTSGQAGI